MLGIWAVVSVIAGVVLFERVPLVRRDVLSFIPFVGKYYIETDKE